MDGLRQLQILYRQLGQADSHSFSCYSFRFCDFRWICLLLRKFSFFIHAYFKTYVAFIILVSLDSSFQTSSVHVQ